jgi:hypothetical protein
MTMHGQTHIKFNDPCSYKTFMCSPYESYFAPFYVLITAITIEGTCISEKAHQRTITCINGNLSAPHILACDFLFPQGIRGLTVMLLFGQGISLDRWQHNVKGSRCGQNIFHQVFCIHVIYHNLQCLKFKMATS